MPIYEFLCNKCKNKFEVLVFDKDDSLKIVCSSCKSEDIEQIISLFSTIGTDGGKSSSCGNCSGGDCSICR